MRPAGASVRLARSVAVAVLAALIAAGALAWNLFPRPPALRAIAVLPFRPLFGVPHDLPLELGLADVLAMRLGKIRRLEVTSSSSTRAFVDSPVEARPAGRRLGVEAVLTGTVHRTAGRVRVSARLLAVESGRTLWSATFDEPFARLLHVEIEIARGAVTALGGTTPEDNAVVSARWTEDAEAYRQHLVGRFHLGRAGADGWEKALEYFERAAKIDPRYAVALSGLADACLALADDDLPPRETLEKARAAAEEALAVTPGLADAHAALARVRAYTDGDVSGAAESFGRAIELAPSAAHIRREHALFLAGSGRHAEADAEAARAVEHDPLSAATRLVRGLVLLAARRDEDALTEARTLAAEEGQSSSTAAYLAGLALLGLQRYDDAQSELRRAVAAAPGSLAAQAALGYALGAAGRREEAETMLAELERLSRGREVSSYYMAVVAAGLGRRGEADRRLDEARRQGSPRLRELRISPVWR